MSYEVRIQHDIRPPKVAILDPPLKWVLSEVLVVLPPTSSF